MEKRYQVFVSSTYQDLIQERIEVIHALLELDCIPVGMEYFPAADDSQWDFIKKLIDESDYYVVVIAGKYGSEDDHGISYTQKEYEYALSKSIPIISFVHSNIDILPSGKTEKDKNKIEKLEKFKDVVKKKLCKFWITPQELGAVVSRSISQAKKNHPRIGWVRADSINQTSDTEVIQLYKRIEQLEKQLSESQKITHSDISNLADGEEVVELYVNIEGGGWDKERRSERRSFSLTWNKLAYYILPKVLNPISETRFKAAVSSSLKNIFMETSSDKEIHGYIYVPTDFYPTIKIQFDLLNFIKYYDIENPKDGKSKTQKMVCLTQDGKNKLVALRAVLKNHAEQN